MKEEEIIKKLAEKNAEIEIEGEREHKIGEHIILFDIYITETEFKKMIGSLQKLRLSFINQGFREPIIEPSATAQNDGRLSFFVSAIGFHGKRIELGVVYLDRFSWSTNPSEYRRHKINPDDFDNINMLNKFEESGDEERALHTKDSQLKASQLNREINEDKRIVETLRSGDGRYSIFFVNTDDFKPNPEYIELHAWDEFVKRADWDKWVIVHGEIGDYAEEKKDLSEGDEYSTIEKYLENKEK